MKGLWLILLSWQNFVFAQDWEVRKSIPEANGKGRWSPVCFAIQNKIYVGGGYIGNFISKKDLWEYDIETDSWNQKSDLPGSLNRTAAIAFSINEIGYVGLGAQAYNTIDYTFLKDLWAYNPATDTWMQKASLPDTARSGSACFVMDNKAFVVGGQTGFPQATADVWMYDPQTDQWTEKQAYPAGPHYGAMAFSLDNYGYVACGMHLKDAVLMNSSQVWRYVPATDTWEQKSDYCDSKGRDNGIAFVLNGKAVVGLGKAKDSLTTYYFKEFCMYSPEKDVWEPYTDFKAIDRAYAIGISVNNRAFAGAGFLYVNEQNFYNDWWELNLNTSLTQKPESNKIVAFPNPTYGKISIQGRRYGDKIQIRDIMGTVIIESDSDEFDLSTYTDGVYVVRITNDVDCQSFKLIKY
ncbi:MAG: kelch repeat-containing protein [Bacteroidia bacterium]|jgi:hypothetical protein